MGPIKRVQRTAVHVQSRFIHLFGVQVLQESLTGNWTTLLIMARPSLPSSVTRTCSQHVLLLQYHSVLLNQDLFPLIKKLVLDHNKIAKEHRDFWPFDFALIYTVKLTAKTIETHLKVHNTGDRPFDFNTLLHTYFLIPVRVGHGSSLKWWGGGGRGGRLAVLTGDHLSLFLFR